MRRVPIRFFFLCLTNSAQEFRPLNAVVGMALSAGTFDRDTEEAVVPVRRALSGSITASKPWTLQVRADGAFFPNQYGANGKPCADLAIRASGTHLFHPVATAPISLLSGESTEGWRYVDFDVRVTIRLTDVRSTYTVTLAFEIS